MTPILDSLREYWAVIVLAREELRVLSLRAMDIE